MELLAPPAGPAPTYDSSSGSLAPVPGTFTVAAGQEGKYQATAFFQTASALSTGNIAVELRQNATSAASAGFSPALQAAAGGDFASLLYLTFTAPLDLTLGDTVSVFLTNTDTNPVTPSASSYFAVARVSGP